MSRLAVGSGALATTVVGASVPVTGMLDAYPLLAGQALRYGLAGLVLLAWARARARPVRRPAASDLPSLIGLAVTGMLGFNACLLLAQRYAEPGFVAALLGGTPLVLALVGPALAGRRPAPLACAGAIVVTAGIIVLSGGGSWHGPGLLLALLAVLCEASFTLLAVRVVGRLGPYAVSTWGCLLAALIGAPVATIWDGPAAWRTPTGRELIALLALAVIVTALAFCCWYHAVSTLGSDRAGVLIGLMPVSGLVASVLLGAQPLTLAASAGVTLVTAGCVLGLYRPLRRSARLVYTVGRDQHRAGAGPDPARAGGRLPDHRGHHDPHPAGRGRDR